MPSGRGPSLRTNVSEQCQAAMIELHGQEAWDAAVAEQRRRADAAAGRRHRRRGGTDRGRDRRTRARPRLAAAAPIGIGVAAIFTILSLVLIIARGVSPTSDPVPLIVGGLGVVLAFMADILLHRRR
jgi:hypothetical protein